MGYFEPAGELPAQDRDISRALASLREEVEAIDYYTRGPPWPRTRS